MSLRDCMEYAVEHSTKVRIQQTDNSDARLRRRDAILNAFTPSISAGVNASSNFGRALDPETNTYFNTTSFNNGYSVSGGIMLFNGFSAVNNIRITKTAVLMGISKEKQLKDGVALATMEAYYNVLYYSQMSEVLAAQVEESRKHLQLAQKEFELGTKGHADVVQMEADLADREYQLISMENHRDDALLTLKDVMLWPMEEELVLESGDESLAECMEECRNIDLKPVEEIAEFAKKTQPAAFQAWSARYQAKLELRKAKWALAPSISLSGGWSTSFYTYPGRSGYTPIPFGNQFSGNSGEFVSVMLSIPIFDGLSRESNISRKKNAYRRADMEYQQTLRDIEAEVARAVQDRDGAHAAYIQADKRSDVQEEAYRLNERKLREGLISPIEFQVAVNKYLSAKAESLNMLFKYRIKSSVVKYYNGIDYIEQ